MSAAQWNRMGRDAFVGVSARPAAAPGLEQRVRLQLAELPIRQRLGVKATVPTQLQGGCCA